MSKTVRLSALALLTALAVAPGLTVAEITVPYTVDEKTQVSFGDMTSVAGHNGLENYLHEYVGGFLHITFTYTHHSCCFSSYSPKIYITAEDPQTTGTPTVRENAILFQLLATTHPTDWYLYDVQFDATGYTVRVTQEGTTEIENTHHAVSGLVATDYAALANDYPLSPTSAFSMSFTPLLVEPAVSGGGGGEPSSRSAVRRNSRGTGDMPHCVETTSGMYCPSEEVRKRETIRVTDELINRLQVLEELCASGECGAGK